MRTFKEVPLWFLLVGAIPALGWGYLTEIHITWLSEQTCAAYPSGPISPFTACTGGLPNWRQPEFLALIGMVSLAFLWCAASILLFSRRSGVFKAAICFVALFIGIYADTFWIGWWVHRVNHTISTGILAHHVREVSRDDGIAAVNYALGITACAMIIGWCVYDQIRRRHRRRPSPVRRPPDRVAR